jgi:2,5-diketo-D-gluconate reductase A
MQVLSLRSNHRIPQLGFGLWQVDYAARVTETALGLGYRLVDGAAIYGNEVGMGQGIRASGLPRKEVFVTTKVWNDRQGYDSSLRAVDESLKRLQLDHVDLCLIHWPCAAKNLYVETWRALMHMRDQGAITSIGVSNFNIEQIDRLTAETGETPVLNQVELHPQFQQAPLRAALAERGIIAQSWTPLGRGQSFDAPAIQAVVDRTGKSAAQVILRWHIQLGVSVIPRSTRTEGLMQNMAIFDFALTQAEMTAIAGLDRNARIGPDPALFG